MRDYVVALRYQFDLPGSPVGGAGCFTITTSSACRKVSRPRFPSNSLTVTDVKLFGFDAAIIDDNSAVG